MPDRGERILALATELRAALYSAERAHEATLPPADWPYIRRRLAEAQGCVNEAWTILEALLRE